MNTTATVLRILARALGVAQILLGLLFWTAPIHQNFGIYTLVPLHMLFGLSIVICLWIVAARVPGPARGAWRSRCSGASSCLSSAWCTAASCAGSGTG